MGKKFDRTLKVAEYIETLSKPVAILLAVLGLIAYDFPVITRTLQEWTAPAAWYQVGTIRRSSDGEGLAFAQNAYDNPVWNGTFRSELLFDLPGKEVLTTDTAVGREQPNLDSQVLTVLDKRVCLHIVDLAFADFQPPKERQGAVTYLNALTGNAVSKLKAVTRASDPADRMSCQPLGAEEYAQWTARRMKEHGDIKISPYRTAIPICPRTILWAKAQRVTC